MVKTFKHGGGGGTSGYTIPKIWKFSFYGQNQKDFWTALDNNDSIEDG